MLGTAIIQAVDFLRQEQNSDGSFKVNKHTSPFYTALILSCLNSLEQDGIDLLRSKSAAFLLSQKSKNWSFNYWVRGSVEAKKRPYPDDLDVTFCVLSALLSYDKKIINGRVLAKAVDLLTILEVKVGGPYRTWIVPEDSDEVWKDIDLAVNSNIGYFLALIGAKLPNLIKLANEHLKKGNLKSPYYVGELPILYFISRFYTGRNNSEFIELIESKYKKGKGWGNSLNTALAVNALLNFKSLNLVKDGVDYLLKNQKYSHWEQAPFVIELNREDTITAGSATLTTAICIEALNKYTHLTKVKLVQKKDTGSLVVRAKVILEAKNQFGSLPPTLRSNALHKIKQMTQLDNKHMITTLPYEFRSSLGSAGSVISDKLIIQLGIANLYGWIAYTIYDDFLDSEGDKALLPVANASLRYMTYIFAVQSKYLPQFDKAFQVTLNKVDGANSWEIKNSAKVNGYTSDFSNFNVLAEKSIGMVLGPLYIMFRLGYSLASPQTKQILSFFNHYLIARQLNDDAHDWEEDFKKGNLTPVTALLIKSQSSKKIEGGQLKLLKEIFWEETIFDVCRLIDKHTNAARKALVDSKVITDLRPMENLLIPIEMASKKAQDETKSTIDFLSAYK